MIRRLAQAVQLIAVVAFVAFGVLLFANEPTLLPAPAAAPAAADGAATEEAPTPEQPADPDEAATQEQPADPDEADEADAAVDVAPEIDAGAIYAERCSSCHGSTGGGGIGPGLSEGRAAAAFPDIEDQVAVVRDGRGRMPAFGNRLVDDDLRAVVRFTRIL